MAFEKYGDLGATWGNPEELDFRNIRAGAINAAELIMVGASSILRSSNFDVITTGWRITGDGSAKFFGLVSIGGDIESANWDGTSPADLSSGPDSGTTTGFYLDSSAGAAQFQSIFAEGGEIGNLDIVSILTLQTGGIFRSSASGQRVEITKTDFDAVVFYTGDAVETVPGEVQTTTGGSAGNTRTLHLKLESPSVFGTGASRRAAFISAHSESDDNSTTPAQIVLGFRNQTQTGEVKITQGAKLMLEDGSASAPSLTYNNDTNTGSFRGGADTYQIATGGAQRIKINSSGTHLTTHNTTAAAANVQMSSSDGRLHRVTSARKYKTRINYNVGYLADIDLRPTKFYRKDDKAWYFGFIADDLADQHKLFGIYDDDEIDNYDLRAVVAVLAAKVNRLEAQLTAL